MTDEVVLFGSFSEDETCSLLYDQMPEERKELSVNSLLLFGSFSEDETHSWLYEMPSNAQKPEEREELAANLFGSFSEDETLSWLYQMPSNAQKPEERKELSVNSLLQRSFSEDETGSSLSQMPEERKELSVNPLLLFGSFSEDETGSLLNGSVNDSAVETDHKEARLKTYVPVSDAQDIKPQGLISSGICVS